MISYEAYVNGYHIDTAGIDVNTYKKSYSINIVEVKFFFQIVGVAMLIVENTIV